MLVLVVGGAVVEVSVTMVVLMDGRKLAELLDGADELETATEAVEAEEDALDVVLDGGALEDDAGGVGVEDEDELLEVPPTNLKGSEYWKVVESLTRERTMP